MKFPRNDTIADFDSSQAIFLRQIMEDFKNPKVHEITCQCSAQSAKTETMIALLLWVIAEDPGPILWVTVNQNEARKIARTRIMPAIDMCAPIEDKIPKDRYGKNTTTIYFPGAPLVIAGADSPANLQSTPYRYIFLDEVRSWKPGAVQMVSKRTRSFPHSYKKVIVSTPSEANDEMHRTFLAGSQSHWHCKCPQCDADFSLEWGDRKTPGGVKWDENEETVIDGKPNYTELLKTIRYKCWGCEKEWFDTPRDRKLLSNGGKWVKYNERHADHVRSYTWNALLPWWTSWKVQVHEFHEALAALRVGAWQPMKDHVNETRGQVWSRDFLYTKDFGAVDERAGDYDVTDFQAMALAAPIVDGARVPFRVGDFEEVRRLFTIDVQGKGGRHYWGVIRAWSKDGRSRLLWAGKMFTVEEIKTQVRQWSVISDNVILDAGKWATEIYQLVVASGYRWKAFKGEPRDHFTQRGHNGLEKVIATVTLVDPAAGSSQEGKLPKIPLILFSKPTTCDLLESMIHGIIPGWEVPEEVDENYKLQVTAYYRHTSVDKHGNETWEWRAKRENHLADCERMQIVGASMTGII